MNKENAIKLYMKATENEGEFSLSDTASYPSVKELKKMLPSHGELKVGKRYVNVNSCLDWGNYAWMDLFSELTGIEFSKNSLTEYRAAVDAFRANANQ